MKPIDTPESMHKPGPKKMSVAGKKYCPQCGGRGPGPYCANDGMKMVTTAKQMTDDDCPDE